MSINIHKLLTNGIILMKLVQYYLISTFFSFKFEILFRFLFSSTIKSNRKFRFIYSKSPSLSPSSTIKIVLSSKITIYKLQSTLFSNWIETWYFALEIMSLFLLQIRLLQNYGFITRINDDDIIIVTYIIETTIRKF